jgi:selT/selW/selH-like putative selenoprotein
LAENILEEFAEFLPGGVTLVPGTKGTFDVSLDGSLLFSKKQVGRHVNEGEVEEMLIPLLEG